MLGGGGGGEIEPIYFLSNKTICALYLVLHFFCVAVNLFDYTLTHIIGWKEGNVKIISSLAKNKVCTILYFLIICYSIYKMSILPGEEREELAD